MCEGRPDGPKYAPWAGPARIFCLMLISMVLALTKILMGIMFCLANLADLLLDWCLSVRRFPVLTASGAPDTTNRILVSGALRPTGRKPRAVARTRTHACMHGAS